MPFDERSAKCACIKLTYDFMELGRATEKEVLTLFLGAILSSACRNKSPIDSLEF